MTAVITGTRVKQGDRFLVRTNASDASQVQAFFNVTYDDGTDSDGFSVLHTPNTDRTTASSFTPGRAAQSGFLTQMYVGDTGVSTANRGQIYARAFIVDRGDTIKEVIGRGYVYQSGDIGLGQFVESLSGKGYLDWIQEGNDVAGNATSTVNLAVTNARRVVRAVIIKYHSSSDVATRTLTITLRDLADSGGPTGWSIASDTWVSPTLTLTANEEGLIHVGEHGFVSTNDAGTLAYADNSSAPNPFPMTVEEGDPVDLIIAAGSGEAADDFDVWVQYEEWIEL